MMTVVMVMLVRFPNCHECGLGNLTRLVLVMVSLVNEHGDGDDEDNDGDGDSPCKHAPDYYD